MDYISREDAINAINGWDKQDVYPPAIYLMALEDIPAADVEERKTGKWKKYGVDLQICSACEKYRIWASDGYDFKYCPNCGAKMEEQ